MPDTFLSDCDPGDESPHVHDHRPADSVFAPPIAPHLAPSVPSTTSRHSMNRASTITAIIGILAVILKNALNIDVSPELQTAFASVILFLVGLFIKSPTQPAPTE